MRERVLFMVLVLPVWLAACDGAPNSPGGGDVSAQVQGNWFVDLTSTSSSASQGEVNLSIRQTGKTLSAAALHAYHYSGSWCLQGGGRMTGSVNGNNVTLNIQVGTALTLKLTGTLSNGVLSGTYAALGSCGNGDAGNFAAEVSPAITSSSWAGTASFPGGSADFTANLSENASGQLSGSITFANSTCVAAVTITGTHWGRLVSITDTNGMVIDMWGAVDASTKTISGYQILGGSVCGFADYTMSRT